MTTEIKAGTHVAVPWGLDEVQGTVLSLFGPAGKQFARIEIELESDGDITREVISLPVDLLSPLAAA